MTHTVGQVADLLDTSGSTVRRWANEFADHLSGGANPGKGTARQFVEVGLALMEIRDARLYRAEFGTFEEYCRERWGMASSRARQLIAAADTVRNLETVTMVTVFPATERQARPLAALPPAQQREAWERVLETAPDGKITAAHVQAVVGRMAEPNDENDDEPEPFHYEVYDEGGGQFSLTVGPDEEIAMVNTFTVRVAKSGSIILVTFPQDHQFGRAVLRVAD